MLINSYSIGNNVKHLKVFGESVAEYVVVCFFSVERMEGPLRNARQIMVDFGRDRSMKRMPFNEEQIHIFNK